MRYFLFFISLTLFVPTAYARKMSAMEWWDPTSMEIWKGLSDNEKDESLQTVLFQDPNAPSKDMPGIGQAMIGMGGAIAGADNKDLNEAEKKELQQKLRAVWIKKRQIRITKTPTWL